MSQAIDLLDEAIKLARSEKAALEQGLYNEAIEMAEKRGEITGMAWNVYEIKDKEEYNKRLIQLSNIQKQLTGIATVAHNTVRQKLKRSRQEKKRLQGYRMAIGQALQ